MSTKSQQKKVHLNLTYWVVFILFQKKNTSLSFSQHLEIFLLIIQLTWFSPKGPFFTKLKPQSSSQKFIWRYTLIHLTTTTADCIKFFLMQVNFKSLLKKLKHLANLHLFIFSYYFTFFVLFIFITILFACLFSSFKNLCFLYFMIL